MAQELIDQLVRMHDLYPNDMEFGHRVRQIVWEYMQSNQENHSSQTKIEFDKNGN